LADRRQRGESLTPKETDMSKLIRICALGIASTVLLGTGLACNTTEGMGKDIEKGGDAIKDTARDVKD
jgi:predicted small secreted protein